MEPTMFEHDTALKVLSPEQEETIHEQAMRILEEIGTDVKHDQARKLLAEAGLKVEDERVYWDRGFVMEQVAKAPSSFRLRGRNPERSLTVGGADGVPVWMNVGGPPFASDLDEGRRERPHGGSRPLHEADAGHRRRSTACRSAPSRPPTSRWNRATWTWSTRRSATRTSRTPPTAPAVRVRATASAMAEIVHGGREAIEAERRADGHREPELAADLGLPDDRRADGVGRGEAADRRDAVPARGRDQRR